LRCGESWRRGLGWWGNVSIDSVTTVLILSINDVEESL
jgi:hypothetical protein